MKTQMHVIIRQDSLDGNYDVIEGTLQANKVYMFLNGRYDGLNSRYWINKAPKEMRFMPMRKAMHKEIGVFTLDLSKNVLNVKGLDYNHDYKIHVEGNRIIVD